MKEVYQYGDKDNEVELNRYKAGERRHRIIFWDTSMTNMVIGLFCLSKKRIG